MLIINVCIFVKLVHQSPCVKSGGFFCEVGVGGDKKVEACKLSLVIVVCKEVKERPL